MAIKRYYKVEIGVVSSEVLRDSKLSLRCSTIHCHSFHTFPKGANSFCRCTLEQHVHPERTFGIQITVISRFFEQLGLSENVVPQDKLFTKILSLRLSLPYPGCHSAILRHTPMLHMELFL